MKLSFFFTFALLLLCSWQSQAQDIIQKEASITGTVHDEKAQPFPFVNVILQNAHDSSMVDGRVTDENGIYGFEKIKSGTYRILITMVGYEKRFSENFTFKNTSIQQPTYTLKTDTQALKEVTITAQKPFIEQQIDRMVLNVENSIVAAGSSALEVLERAPGVIVDQQNDQLKLRGKNGVIVQIDGKQTFLSQQELMTLLRNTPSDNIEKIELITNPSSKYDAAGNSGIINIKMKKNKNYGSNGNINLSGGYAQQPRGSASVSINNRAGKVSSFFNAGTFYSEGFNNNEIYRIIPFENKTTIFDQRTERINKSKYHNLRVGVDYFLNNKTTIGVLASGFYNNWNNPFGETNTRILNQDLSLQRTFKTEVLNGNKMKNGSINLNLKHQFDDKGKELTFDVDYVGYNGRGKGSLNTRYAKPDGSADGAPEIVRTNMPSNIDIAVAKLDYTAPLGKGKFETGLKSSYVTSNNTMVYETFQDVWAIDSSRSNQFKYLENVNAGYLNYSGSLSKKIKIQLGLRAEHTHSIGNSITLNTKKDRNYINLFPSVFLTNQLDTNNVLNFSYSRRIDRPNYQLLNPFEFYLDPYTFQKGNPNLKPQYTNSFQLTHIFKNIINTSFGYSLTKDLISDELPQQIASENKTFVSAYNLDQQNAFNLTLSAPIRIQKWWNIQANATGVYNHTKSIYLDAPLSLKQYSWNGYANSQFTLKKGWSAEISGYYNSKALYGLYQTKAMYALNAGVQKSLFNKKATIRVNVNDIFWTNRFRGHALYEDIDFRVKSEWPSRQVRVSLAYNFGNQNVKGARQRNTGSDDLKNRAGGNN